MFSQCTDLVKLVRYAQHVLNACFFTPQRGSFLSVTIQNQNQWSGMYMYIYIWAFSWNWLVVNYAIPSSVRQTFDKDNIPPVLPAKFFADLWRNLVSFLIKCCFCFFWIIVYFQTHLSSSRGCFGSCAGARLPSKRLRNTLWKKTSSPTAQGALLVHVLWCAWTSGN